jgi:hypothetical protein
MNNSIVTDSRLAHFATTQTFEFDGTTYTVAAGTMREAFLGNDEVMGIQVVVTEGGLETAFWTVDGSDLYATATRFLSGVLGVSDWTLARIAYTFSLAGRKIARA